MGGFLHATSSLRDSTSIFPARFWGSTLYSPLLICSLSSATRSERTSGPQAMLSFILSVTNLLPESPRAIIVDFDCLVRRILWCSPEDLLVVEVDFLQFLFYLQYHKSSYKPPLLRILNPRLLDEQDTAVRIYVIKIIEGLLKHRIFQFKGNFTNTNQLLL